MMVTVWIISAGLFITGTGLLIQGIKQIQKFVGGPIFLKLPFNQKSGQFTLTSEGSYGIWQSGRGLYQVPITMSVPEIANLQTGKQLAVSRSFSSVRINNGWEGRIQVFTFWAKAGQYALQLTADPATVDSQRPFNLEIRERRPAYQLVFNILLLIFAAFCLIAGLVLPFVVRN